MKNISLVLVALVLVLVATPAAGQAPTPPPVDDYESFNVNMGGTDDTDSVVKKLEGRGVSINGYITQENFPLATAASEEYEVVILVPVPEGTWLTEEDGLELLRAAGLERPSYQTALRFAEQYAAKTTSSERPFVVFLHQSWQDPLTIERVLYVHRAPDDRRLHLDYINSGFGGDCMIAGVLPLSRRSEK